LTGGTTADRGLNGIATVNKAKTQAQILIYDHNFGTGANPVVATVTDSVHLTVNNVPFGPGKIKVDRYGVDKNHSNSFTTWVNQGRPAKPSTTQWDALQTDGELKKLDSTASVTLTGTTFTKAMPQLQPGVSLLVLTSDNSTGTVGAAGPAKPGAVVLHSAPRGNVLTLSYSLPSEMRVTLTVSNSLGQTVAVPVFNRVLQAGEHSASVGTLAPGTYFCVLNAGETVVRASVSAVLR
jgi:hypothetical protein